MDFNSTVDLIIRDLDEARDIIDDLKNYPGVPLIQVELAKSKCKSAAEVIALLKNQQKDTYTRPQKPSREQSQEPVRKREEKRVKENLPASVPEKKDIDLRPGGQSVNKPGESTIVADTFGLSDRLNETMGTRRDDEGVADILKSKPLTSLSEAIGVNDRFLFIREVFNGNQEDYNQAIKKLDSAASLDEAKSVLMSYSSDSKENEAVKQLLSLVKRKFPSDE